jgi:hypothetical protein
MTEVGSTRDRVSYLRNLALSSLAAYRGGFRGLEAVASDIKSIIRSLQEVADRSWTDKILRKWGQLEILYALALDEGRSSLTREEEEDVRQIIDALTEEFLNP